MASVWVTDEKIVCHCLRISEREIGEAVANGTIESVRCVINETGAGSGCTACHAAIKGLLAGPCQSFSSPT